MNNLYTLWGRHPMDLLLNVYGNALRESHEIKFNYVPAIILQKWLLFFPDTFHDLTSDIAFKTAFALPGSSPLPVPFIKFWQGVENLVDSNEFNDALRGWKYKHVDGFRTFRDQVLFYASNDRLNVKAVLNAVAKVKEESTSSFWNQVANNVKKAFDDRVPLDTISTMIYSHFCTIDKLIGVRYIPRTINYKEKYLKLLHETNECIQTLIPSNSESDVNDSHTLATDFSIEKQAINSEIVTSMAHSEELVKCKQEIEELNLQIEKLINELNATKHELAESKSEAVKLSEDILSMKEESNATKEDLANANQELQLAREECDRVKLLLSTKHENDEASAWEMTSLKNQLDVQETQLTDALEERKKYAKIVDELNSQNNEFKQTLDIVNSELQLTRDLLNEKTKELEQSTNDLEEIQNKFKLSQNKIITEKQIELEKKIQNLELINRDLQCEITLLEQEANGWKNAACELDIEKALLTKQLSQREAERNVNRSQMYNKSPYKNTIGVVPKLNAAISLNKKQGTTLSTAETSDSLTAVNAEEENFSQITTISTDDSWV